MRFAVFTHVIHREQEDGYYAYSPYVREMNLWFKYVEEAEIVGTIQEKTRNTEQGTRGNGEKEIRGNGEKETGGRGEPYKHSRINFTKIPSFHLLNFPAVLDSFIKIPIIFFKILDVMRRADHLHLRCPGNIGLLAAIAQVFFPKKPKTVKYAGNWDPEAKQPWTYRLQKWILSNTFLSRNIKVLVYGDWAGQSKNIVPFFTASFSEKDREVVEKDFILPYKFVYTGNLVQGKGVFEAIELIESLRTKGVKSELEIYGDGILKDSLSDYIQRHELQDFVILKGRKSLEELKKAYKKAHFVVLLSKSEGWPKTIAEGMWYGCIPVATPVSCVSWMLGEGSRGILVGSEFKVQSSRFNVQGSKFNVQRSTFNACPPGRVQGSANPGEDESLDDILRKVWAVIENPEEMTRMSLAAQEWSQQYTLERFDRAIREMI
ncbi:glycosyltransferase family 4 protein [Salegentibacter flavus]|uniref:Glycosyltransferase involved in cell wall bisynthesis n=1 Tax=Salegentibacter flavus TaxID=287099 RepID=A0A1I4Y723_9FLAO|nr:glycosyltransferase [Salegentibacter flavus]SFN33310.1 Glycosyltransferase involved in cell wall bisynthesis [Salegentibacter flavus]